MTVHRPRFRIRLVPAALALLVLLVSCGNQRDWLRFRGEGGLGATSTSIRPPLAVKWKLRLQLNPDLARFFNPPIIMDGTIYFGSFDGNFYALDIESGYMRWVFKAGQRINSIPCGDENNVYFGADDGKLYAVSRRTGKLAWEYSTGEEVQSQVMKYKNMIVFVTNNGAGYFLDTDGNLLFTIPNPVWQKYTFQILDDTMYFAPGNETEAYGMSPFHIPTRTYQWTLDTSALAAYWYSVPAVDERRVYMSTATPENGSLYFNFMALDRLDGRVLWQTEDESAFSRFSNFGSALDLIDQYKELLDYEAPSLWGDLVIYAAGDTKVRAYYQRSGALAWEHQFDFHTSSSTTVAGDRVYFGLDGSDDPNYAADKSVPAKLVCLSAGDGRLLWDTPIEGRLLSAPVIAGKWIVFGTHQHVFYVLEEVF
jgi:outer membrane protein assembly factor BamB